MHFAPNNKKNEDAGGGIGAQSSSGGATASSSGKPRGPARTYSLDSNKSGSSASAALLKKARSKPARTKSLDIDDDKVRRSKPARTYSADSSMSGSSLASMRSSARRGRKRDGSAKQRTSYFRLILLGLGAMFLSIFYQLIMSGSIDDIASIAKVDADDTSTRSQQRQPNDHQYNQRQNVSSTVSYGSMNIGTAANRTQQSRIKLEKPGTGEEHQEAPVAKTSSGDGGRADSTTPAISTENNHLQLHDRTVHLSSDVLRPWLDSTSSSSSTIGAKPHAKVLLTNYGWNHPNQTIGLSNPRSARTRDLLQGVVDHRWFDPSGWDDILSGKAEIDPDTRYYVFLDVETCFEANYPDYEKATFEANSDKEGGRRTQRKNSIKCYNLNFCPCIPNALKTPLFKAPSSMATLVVFDCKGDGPPKSFRKESGLFGTSLISVASVSSAEKKLNLNVDQGLPPPAVKPVILSPDQEKDIETCNDESRPYLLTFSGAGRGEASRKALVALNNDKDIITVQRRNFKGIKEVTYNDLLTKAKFSAAPRGTNLFSYRFTEVMSGGAIPVVHADGWVWPFRKELIDWSECAVIMPEPEANRTEEVLRGIDAEQRCRMRKRCYEIYKKYMATGEGVVAGLVEGLELLATSPATLPADDQSENLKPPPFHLNDPTITASPNVERLWLEEKVEDKPPAKILLTDFGWNNPNKTLGLKYVRTIRQRELLQGVVDHKWFDPLGWDDINSGRVKADPSIRYYVFLDVETCFELNYPIYSGRGLKDNGDKAGNRTVGTTKHDEECYRLTACPYVPKVLDSRLFSEEGVQSTLVIINCRGNGYPKKFRKRKAKGPSVAVAAVSTPEHKIQPSIDQGLPPPAVKPLVLTPEQEKDIETCNEEKRPYLLTFSGAGRGEGARRAIVALNNNKDIITMKRSKFTGEELSYEELLGGSKFSAAPRGTNLFSYRFTEVLSAGSIPVVHADGWVWPFRKELVDWSECAVIMPESEANRTEEVLRAITPEERCKMRKRCYELYKKYIETGDGVIAGIIDGLELMK